MIQKIMLYHSIFHSPFKKIQNFKASFSNHRLDFSRQPTDRTDARKVRVISLNFIPEFIESRSMTPP